MGTTQKWLSHAVLALIAVSWAFVVNPFISRNLLFLSSLFSAGATYTVFYNVINYPAGSVPVTKVTAEDEAKMADYPAKTRFQKEMKKVHTCVLCNYTAV